MNKNLVKFLTMFMPSKADRKLFRKFFLNKGSYIAEKEEIIKNISYLLSSTTNKIELLKQNLALIEIETFSYCNRQCWFCPNKFIDRHSENKYMSEENYLKILDNLSEIDYSGIVTYSRYNEPFADKIILKRLSQAREKLPKANLYTHTNGDFLTKDYIKELEKCGMNTIKVQYYLKENETFDKEKVLDNMKKQVIRFANNYKVTQFRDDYVEIKVLNDTIDIIYQAINFQNFACNRGGTLDIKKEYRRNMPCYIPFTNMYIDYSGNVVPCCNFRSDIEAHKNFILGNIADNTLAEIFSNTVITKLRRELVRYDVSIEPCASCDFGLYYIPNTLVERR